MKIFKSESMYDFKKFPKTSHRKKYFKEDERGRQEMCEIVERYAREVALEEAREIAYTLLKDGVDFNLVRKAVKNLSEEELQEIYQGVKKHL